MLHYIDYENHVLAPGGNRLPKGEDCVEYRDVLRAVARGEVEIVPPPPPSLTDVRSAAVDRLADIRWRHETGGCSVDGIAVRSDRETRAMLTSAIAAGIAETPWKLGNGQWAVLSASQMASIAAGIAAHVSACFARERALADQLAAASTPAEVASVDLSAGWPTAQ